MRTRFKLLGLALLASALAFGLAPNAPAADKFPLQDGDTWVMVGDSITAQHLHSNYFEAFCFARYPTKTFRFRNSGVGGDTVPKVLARFDWDVAAWKPRVVSVELGMNDQGGYSVEQFVANMQELTARIRAVPARPVLFTSSPINNGATNANLDGNAKLHQFAVALQAVAAEQNVPFADQFHAVIDVWGKNRPRELVANALATLKGASLDDDLAGVQPLRAFLTAQEKSLQPLVSMQGDPVHPGPCGQLIMAAALLKELGADGFVSRAVLDAQGQLVEVKGCEITGVKAEGGKLTLDRKDQSLPFPIPDEARPVLPLFPAILELSQYTLQVTGLPSSRYDLAVNGTRVTTASGQELAAGINLTVFPQGPLAAQGKAILAAVGAKEQLVGQWRGLSRTVPAAGAPSDAKQKLAELTQQVEAADVKIREAAQPPLWHIELTPMQTSR